MTRSRLLGLAAGLVLAMMPGAQATELAEENARLSGSHHTQSFLAGGSVTIDATSSDGVFAAGGDILVEGARLEDLIMAGGWLTFTSSTAKDLIAAGGNLSVDGEIEDDVLAAGFRVSLGRRARIGGDVRLAGAYVRVDGEVAGDLKISAARVRIEGRVEGDLDLLADDIRISPDAVILGAISYRSPGEADISSRAQIGGPIERRMAEEFESPLGFFGIVGAIILAALGGLVALVLLAAAAQGLVPRLLDSAAQTMGRRTWASLGLGFAVLVGAPAGAVLLFTTLVGAPLGVVLLAIYVVALAFALVVAGYWIGQRLRAIGHREGAPERFWQRLWWSAVGLALLALLTAIPFVGGFIGLIALIAGLGAFTLQAWPRAVEAA